MNLIKEDIKKLFYKFLIPTIRSSLAIVIYRLIDTPFVFVKININDYIL